MNDSLVLSVQEPSQAGEARRQAAAWGSDRGWSAEMAGRVALIVTELGRNLALHTNGGRLLLRSLSQHTAVGVEIISLDSGPGVANFQECLRDGYSTAGTSGTGLGAVRRASQLFAVHSQAGVGTALLTEVWGSPPEFRAHRRWTCGGVNVALPTEQVSGDSWTEQHPREGVVRVMIADGLGHGEFAAQASAKAVEIFGKFPGVELVDVLERMHEALRTTRGAAVALAELDLGQRVVNYVGVGNISGQIATQEGTHSLISLNGTVGGQCRQVRSFSYAWPPGAVLIMNSDGLKSQWQLGRYPGLLERPPSLVAAVLFRDHARERDDATVIAVRASA